MNRAYIIDYVNENEFKKKEKAIKKYNMLAYKKLLFEYYPALREGNFQGVIVSTDKENGIVNYELKLPTDKMFAQVHGNIVLHYSVYEGQKIVMLKTLSPEEVLAEGHREELTTYKGVMVTKSNKDRDIFMIDLFSELNKNGFSKLAGLLLLLVVAVIILGIIIFR